MPFRVTNGTKLEPFKAYDRRGTDVWVLVVKKLFQCELNYLLFEAVKRFRRFVTNHKGLVVARRPAQRLGRNLSFNAAAFLQLAQDERSLVANNRIKVLAKHLNEKVF